MSRASTLGAIAIGALVLAYAQPMPSVGCAQTSHYAAIRAIANGVPYIDRWAEETCDLVHAANGHFYAAKGPAMDFWTAPWYLLLHAAGAVPGNRNHGMGYPAAMLGVPLRALWQVTLWAVVLPALGLLLLVRRAVERIEPGLGTLAAVVLGLGTLVLPFSTLLFAHVPATALAFLSFVLLFDPEAGSAGGKAAGARQEDRAAFGGAGAGPRRVAAAGAAAGLACATDLPLAVPAVLLGLYAAARAPRLRRLVLFGAGGIVGLVPLLVFDTWAFGSPFHLSYSGVALNPGANGIEQSPGNHGFFQLQLPSFRVAIELLLSQRGLLVVMPVVAAGAAGVFLLRRRGLRAEAALVAALCVAEVTWNSGHNGYANAIGGWVPGPRFLIPLLPFLVFALAPVLRRAPLTAGVLALVSAGAMVLATSTEPLLQNDDTRHWASRLVHGNFTATVFSLTGIGHGWLAILPFFACVLVAAGAAVATARGLPLGRRDAAGAAAALVAWILVEHGAPELLRVDRLVHQAYGLAAAILLVAAAVWAVLRVRAAGARAALPALPLLAFATVRFDDHTKWALALSVLVLGALWVSDKLSPARRSASA